MNKHIKSSLHSLLEGTFVAESSKYVELDLKNEKWCSCSNPTGFKFVTYEGREQIWRHLSCGGLVIKPLVDYSNKNK